MDKEADLAQAIALLRQVAERPGEYASHPLLETLLDTAGRMVRALKGHDKAERKKRDRELLAATGIRKVREGRASDNAGPLSLRGHEPTARPDIVELSLPRRCYVCRQEYRRLHGFYDCLCPSCGDENYAKRTQTADLAGRIALVTGGRVKIGYEIALQLLRSGAIVLATTRFPQDAARRYAQEPDFKAWAERLRICALDLRHLAGVERFADHLAATYPRLDILINNAAQTVRRPPAFYAHLIEGESQDLALLPDSARQLLTFPVVEHTAPVPGVTPAAMTQLRILPCDESGAFFPPGLYDGDRQQVDLRPENSWSQRIADVSTWEMLEVHAVNCLAPFILIRKLEPMLLAPPDRDRFIVNVSAREGQLNCQYKTGAHPHTNMSKAALNMLTRTCAGLYAKQRIFMNSVDTGWVTNEHPHPVAKEMEQDGFEPPLDVLDGAARVLDPIFTAINTGRPAFGKLFKDYRETTW